HYPSYSFQSYPHHRHLHSFPTRRSSDLSKEEARGVRAIAEAGLDATVMAAARTVRKDVDACIDCGVDEIALFTAGSDLNIRHKRSEEHTSELQSRGHLVCRLLLEKKKKK